MDVPLEILDREVALAALALARGHAALARGALATPSPLEDHRRASERATWLDLAPPAPSPSAPPGTPPLDNPLRPALRAWLYALTLERVLWADAARLASARRAETIAVDQADLDAAMTSPRAVLARVLVEPDRARRRLWAGVLERGSDAVAEAARVLAQRRAEAAHRLLADPDAEEIPLAPRPGVAPGAALRAIAEDLLRRTEAAAPRDGTPWQDVIAAAVGRSLAEGWPARLRSRWLEDLFRDTGLTDGLRPAVGELPAALGASSFARALAAFGAALADAERPRGVPFALAHVPFDLRRARRAALFAGLVADPVFAWRALGLGRDRARKQARGVARALALGLRLDAARVLARGALALPDPAGRVRFEEATAAALGAPLPTALAGVVPRLSPADPTALLGAVLAAADRRALVERFDEDWFRSPHAARAIREEDAALPPSRHAAPEALDAGLAELARAMDDLG